MAGVHPFVVNVTLRQVDHGQAYFATRYVVPINMISPSLGDVLDLQISERMSCGFDETKPTRTTSAITGDFDSDNLDFSGAEETSAGLKAHEEVYQLVCDDIHQVNTTNVTVTAGVTYDSGNEVLAPPEDRIIQNALCLVGTTAEPHVQPSLTVRVARPTGSQLVFKLVHLAGGKNIADAPNRPHTMTTSIAFISFRLTFSKIKEDLAFSA
jgi:hypothetical protein